MFPFNVFKKVSSYSSVVRTIFCHPFNHHLAFVRRWKWGEFFPKIFLNWKAKILLLRINSKNTSHTWWLIHFKENNESGESLKILKIILGYKNLEHSNDSSYKNFLVVFFILFTQRYNVLVQFRSSMAKVLRNSYLLHKLRKFLTRG